MSLDTISSETTLPNARRLLWGGFLAILAAVVLFIVRAKVAGFEIPIHAHDTAESTAG